MRTEESGYWLGLRRCLCERGVDPATAMLASTFPDDVNNWYGVIITPDGHIHDFDYDYPPGREEEGEFTIWENTTDTSDPLLRSLAKAVEQEQ